MNKKHILITLILTLAADSLCYFPFNLFRFDNVLLQPYKTGCNQLELNVLTEISTNVKGRNGSGEKVNPLNIWNKDQDALAMLRGFNPDSEIGELAAALNGVNDDGIRGHFDLCGNLHMNDIAFIGRWYLPKGFWLDLFMPFYFMKLKCIELDDLTANITYQDLLTHELLTDNIVGNLKKLGDLNVRPWEKSGPGDLVLSLWWKRDFRQEKPWLKNVRTSVRGGVTVPTGLKADINDIFPIPFGMNGAGGLFLGGYLEVTWGNCIKAGIDLQFLNLFGKARKIRIKTDENQTDIFLLAKCDAYLDFGFTQEYFLFLHAYRVFRGMSFKLAYNYIFNQQDEIYLKTTNFSNTIANTAQYLEDWTMHSFILMMDYEWENLQNKSAKLSLFWKQPFNGRRSVQAVTFGAQFSYMF